MGPNYLELFVRVVIWVLVLAPISLYFNKRARKGNPVAPRIRSTVFFIVVGVGVFGLLIGFVQLWAALGVGVLQAIFGAMIGRSSFAEDFWRKYGSGNRPDRSS